MCGRSANLSLLLTTAVSSQSDLHASLFSCWCDFTQWQIVWPVKYKTDKKLSWTTCWHSTIRRTLSGGCHAGGWVWCRKHPAESHSGGWLVGFSGFQSVGSSLGSAADCCTDGAASNKRCSGQSAGWWECCRRSSSPSQTLPSAVIGRLAPAYVMQSGWRPAPSRLCWQSSRLTSWMYLRNETHRCFTFQPE